MTAWKKSLSYLRWRVVYLSALQFVFINQVSSRISPILEFNSVTSLSHQFFISHENDLSPDDLAIVRPKACRPVFGGEACRIGILSWVLRPNLRFYRLHSSQLNQVGCEVLNSGDYSAI
jgi:hypothetical protein